MKKTKNILMQAFVCIPISGLLAFCWFKGLFELIKFNNILFVLLLFFAVIFISFVHCVVKGQKTVVTTRRGDYKYQNKFSFRSPSHYNTDKFVRLQLAGESEKDGFELSSDGYFTYFSGWTLFTILFAPIFVVTEFIGLIFAFISSPKNRIYSSYQKLEYSDYKAPFFQRILHFFFNFVIW